MVLATDQRLICKQILPSAVASEAHQDSPLCAAYRITVWQEQAVRQYDENTYTAVLCEIAYFLDLLWNMDIHRLLVSEQRA